MNVVCDNFTIYTLVIKMAESDPNSFQFNPGTQYSKVYRLAKIQSLLNKNKTYNPTFVVAITTHFGIHIPLSYLTNNVI